jgi:radical SAM superfamily enzyme YgiQ (UPF0313 family)
MVQVASGVWSALAGLRQANRQVPVEDRQEEPGRMRVHLVNPSHISFGIGVITPRWLYVLAAATPARFGDPRVVDETLEPLDPETIQAGDTVGIGIHTGNALRGYEVGRLARERGAFVVFGGIHATLFPDEPHELGGAHAVVRGDGDQIWGAVLDDVAGGAPKRVYEAGWVEPEDFLPGRWDLLPRNRYMWASVQTVRGCPKHCSFCSVWRTDGQRPRQRPVESVFAEIVDLRRRGFRFIALADDNFYPVTLTDLKVAARRADGSRLRALEAMRADRFTLMARLAQLPPDTIMFTQITMEAAEDDEFLEAMRKARIKGALVGVEAVSPEGLHDVYKDFNPSGEELVERLRAFRRHDVHVLGSFIFGLPTDKPATFDLTADLAERADITFAQFVPLIPFPGTVDFEAWGRKMDQEGRTVDGIPLSRPWLIPMEHRASAYISHPTMSPEEIRRRTQQVWDRFYAFRQIWRRSRCVKSPAARAGFVLISKLYRQMYANTGITSDSARVNKATRWARWIAKPCRRLFAGTPMPELEIPAP